MKLKPEAAKKPGVQENKIPKAKITQKAYDAAMKEAKEVADDENAVKALGIKI